MQNSLFNGTDGICGFLNFTTNNAALMEQRANLSQQVGAVLDANASWAERILVNPVLRQYYLAKCNVQYQLTKQADSISQPGSLALLLSQFIGTGILACISVCFNISLIVVTFRHIKEYKVCTWLLAFDALCQLFTMATFLANFFAFLFGVSAMDFRLCMASLLASVMGTYSSVLTIFLISVERMLLTLAPMRMSLLEIPSIVRKWSLVAVSAGSVFGLFMSCKLLLYINVLVPFTATSNGAIICPISVFLVNINTPISYILLLLAQLNYITIFSFILWRYFTGSTSGEHFRRVLRAVFILSLVVLVGWLLSVSFVPINALFFTALQWVFRLFGSDPFKSEDLFYSIFMPLQSLVHWVNIMASAGGAPILFLTSLEYRNAYKKMLARTQVVAKDNNGPLFIIQRRNENGIMTQATSHTTAVAS